MPRTKIWKDGLYEGTFVTTKGQIFDCTRKDKEYYRDRVKAMLANGSALPWCWEHQHDDSGTIGLSASDLLARWAQNTGGHIHDVRFNGDGPLEFLMDVDAKDIPKLEAVKFVSPDIRQNWRDRHGPAFDKVGPYWPGPSIAHLAVTPIPVQYPQRPFEFDTARLNTLERVSLSAAVVDVSLSAAQPIQLSAQGKPMPFPPKDDDETPEETPDEGAPPEASDDDSVGLDDVDLEGGGPIEDPVPEDVTDGAVGSDEGAAMRELEAEASDLGIELHASAHKNLLSMVQHFCTALKTHKATKSGGSAGDEPPDPNTPDPSQNPTNPLEPEVAESPPIMMSAATPLTPREKTMLKGLLRQSVQGQTARINTLHTRGYIDAQIKADLMKGLDPATVRLSMADVTDDGTVKPGEVEIKIQAYEAIMKTGKAGSFAPPSRNPAPPARKPNPHKPISEAIALSAGEVAVDPPYGDDGAHGEGEGDAEVIDRLSGGLYSAQQSKNGKAA